MDNWILHLHRIHIKGELSEIYINLAMRNFALSLISVFVPIYLLKLGYALNQVIFYNLVFFATAGVFSVFTAYLVSKWGFKHVVTISIPLMALQMAFLYSLETYKISIYLIAFIGGLSLILYWVPLNADFARSSKKEARGKETSILNAVSGVARLLGPVIGALILKFYNFNLLFGIVLILLMFSIVPLFWTIDVKKPTDLRFNVIFSRKHFRYLIKFMSQGFIFLGEAFVWPLFIYLFALNTLNVGIATSLKGIGAIIFALIVGKLADIKSRTSMIKTGAFLYAVLWLFRHYITTPLSIFIFSFVGGLLITLINIPFFAKVSDKANKEDILEFMTFRELGLCIGRVIFLTVMFLIVAKFVVTFHLIAISTFPFILW